MKGHQKLSHEIGDVFDLTSEDNHPLVLSDLFDLQTFIRSLLGHMMVHQQTSLTLQGSHSILVEHILSLTIHINISLLIIPVVESFQALGNLLNSKSDRIHITLDVHWSVPSLILLGMQIDLGSSLTHNGLDIPALFANEH
jgi:hypothetical protein